MSISLSMPINCSLEIPNSAARSWIRVVATLTPPLNPLSVISHQPSLQSGIGNADGLYGRPPEACPQFRGCWAPDHRAFIAFGKPPYLLQCALPGIRRQHHTHHLAPL